MLRRTTLIAPALALALAGCATSNYNEILADEALQQTMLKNHVDFENRGLLDELLVSDEEKQREKINDAEQRIARLEQQLQREQLARERPTAAIPMTRPAPNGPIPKVGLLVSPAIDPQLSQQIETAFHNTEATYPISAVAAETVRTQAHAYGCTSLAERECAAKLATYPGVHLIAQIEDASLDDSGKLRARASVIDTTLGQAYTLPEIILPTVDGKTTQLSVQGMMDNLVLRALDKSKLAPWSTRAFSREGDTWYLAAGERSGLKVGDILEVRGAGRVVMAPNGTPAGWIPGSVKGTLRVKGLFGDDLAAAELVEGTAPTTDDMLLPRKAN